MATNLRCAFRVALPLVGAVVAPAESSYTTPYIFNALAGAPSIGSVDGTGREARFYNPAGTAVDQAGNVYVADEKNHTIRRITPAGVVTTFAGVAGFPGLVDGPAATARFRIPKGVVIDDLGNVYVADGGNSAIRKITPAGEVSTLAGNGIGGRDDGTGGAARFGIPFGLALGPAGDLFVADTTSNTIRKVTPAGVVTTFAGSGDYGSTDGTGRNASFFYPQAVAVDAAGTVYVAETGNCTVRKITPAGVVTTLAGTALVRGSVDGIGGAALFASPAGIAVDATGNIFVADFAIRRITPGGAVTTTAGVPGADGGSADGTGAAAQFAHPNGIAVDAAGNLILSDRDNNTIRKITSGAVVSTVAGLPPQASQGSVDGIASAARFYRPGAIAVGPAGDVYVVDEGNQAVRRITAAGATTTLATGLDVPDGIAVDASGNVYVSLAGNHTIGKLTAGGTLTTFAGPAPNPGHPYDPSGLALDASGNLYVADPDHDVIRKVTPAGLMPVFAGAEGNTGSTDGTAFQARFYAPYGVAVDAAGNVLVADTFNHTIRRITTAGVVTTLAGQAGVHGSTDGPAATARFSFPTSVAVDAAGNVFVTDSGNQTVRKIGPDGTVSTVAGQVQSIGSAGGKGEIARFSHPSGIAVNANGLLYVTNGLDSNTVVVGALSGRPVITAQPRAATVTAGGSAQFSVTAVGDPAPAYQWYRNGGAIQGANAAALTLGSAQPADAGDYSVVISNPLGNATSTPVALTVTAAPVPPAPPTPSSGADGGAGGGALNPWFSGALLALWLAGRRSGRRSR